MNFVLFASVSIVASVVGAATSHAAPLDGIVAFAGEISNVMLGGTCFVIGLLGVARLAGANR